MSDIDGMDAFNAVLDRMIDAEHRVATLHDEKRTADQRATRAETDARDLRERNARLAAELADAKADAQKMRKAGEALIAAVRRMKNMSPEIGEAALAAEKAFDDDIPF